MALVELGRFSPTEAHLLIARLEDDEIMAIAFDAGTSVLEGSIAFLIPVRVMVDQDDLPAARRIRDFPA